MDMPAVDVLVQIDDVGLVAVAHLLHVLACQFRELPVRERSSTDGFREICSTGFSVFLLAAR